MVQDPGGAAKRNLPKPSVVSGPWSVAKTCGGFATDHGPLTTNGRGIAFAVGLQVPCRLAGGGFPPGRPGGRSRGERGECDVKDWLERGRGGRAGGRLGGAGRRP